MADDDVSVRVALRIRPQVSSEVIDMCRVCTTVTPGEPQVTLGQDKSFTFDYVFDMPAEQEEVFEQCVAGLVRGSLDGYNATVFAYGQTGSGKTYTMGTGFEIEPSPDSKGILPRAVEALFNGIQERKDDAKSKGLIPPEFTVISQFMELYNEEVIDLFDPSRDNYSKNNGRFRIHEDGGGGISVTGVTLKPVKDIKETLTCLRHGALARTTAATRMNATSSRSHAVFTLHVKQQRLIRAEENGDNDTGVNPTNDFETLSAKFHFVDLAGSERLKRTGATGERAKEGISINCGLLALGNVISALGDKSKKVTHVPYRDSKLTRLLQDSLGGNSQTVMIACVSPSDRDFMETLNTLKYANRARNIKNRIVINQDKSSRTIALLRQEIIQLQTELLEFKQGKRVISDNGEEGINDMYHENTVLQSELNNLRIRVKAMQGTIDQISQKNTELLSEKAMGAWMNANGDNATDNSMTEIIQGYINEIEDLRAKLMEANITYEMLKKNMASKQNNMHRSFVVSSDVDLLETSCTVINDAKKELYKERELLAKGKGEMEFQRKNHNASGTALDYGERERAEGESADDSDGSNDGEDSESDDDTDSETKICAQLALLTNDIDTKQRLIEELERSQRSIHLLRRHYEDKLLALHTQIKLTQEERDKVLASYGNQLTQPTDKVKRVKDEYERKLTDMQRELKRLQVFQREHTKLLRSQSTSEHQLKSLKNELVDMKRNKVKLLNKMKEESTRHKQTELKRNREIAQLKKESRKNANTIKSLEAEKRLKEQVLKRKQEEVSALRRGNKQQMMSNKAAGRIVKAFSPRQAKHKWQEFEKVISKVALNKQAIGDLERDMERHLAERELLGKDLDILKHKRARALRNRLDTSDIDNEIDTVNSNIEYLQENIAETQHNIMQFEEAKDGTEDSQLQSILSNISDVSEARYLLEKLYNVAVNQLFSSTQIDMQLKESQAKIQELHNESKQKEVMFQLMNTTGDFYDDVAVSSPTSPGGKTFIVANKLNNEISSGTSTRSVSPVDSTLFEIPTYNGFKAHKRLHLDSVESSPSSTSVDSQMFQSDRTPSFQRNNNQRGSVRLREIGIFSNNDRNGQPPSIMTQSMGGESQSGHTGQPLARVPSAPGSLKGLTPHKALASTPSSDSNRPSPFLSRKSYTIIPDPFITSPRFGRKTNNNLNTTITLQQPTIGKPSPIEQFGVRGRGAEDSVSPPRSPGSRRRDADVFCRLAGAGTHYEQPIGGVIKEYTGRGHAKAPLQCVHIAEGHSSAVLSVCATEDLLFSSSADRTVKVWDLNTCSEYCTLIGHPNSVVTVRYNPTSRLVFCAASAYVKIWDLRSPPHKAIKTLCSSGSTQSSTIPLAAISRTVHIPAGESQIYDIALNHRGNTIYTASADKVRVWDLRKFESTGKVQSGHTAAVMCLSVGTVNDNDDIVITGSKDHYIKVFEVRNALGGAVSIPRMHLEPPHYDGVQCLTLSPDLRTLYSGSRDMSIKMWNLENQELVHAANNAHKNWVTGLALLNSGSPTGGPILVSSCKAGYLQLWDAHSCQSFAQMKTDNFAINAIATNSSQIFTASNDGKVKIWNFNSKFTSIPKTPTR